MKQTKTLYCLTIGFLHGARLDKTNNYDAVNNGYSFKVPFTTLTFVKQCDLNQPVNHTGDTYIFGFAPQDMFRIAALTKKDLEDALQAELHRINATRKKLQSGWEKVAAVVPLEVQAVERAGGAPPIPSPANSVTPATVPMMPEGEAATAPEQPAQTAPEPPPTMSEPQAAPKQETSQSTPNVPPSNSPQSAPEVPVSNAPKAEEPVSGEVARAIDAYNIYVASAKSKAADSQSIGYSATIKNLQTGEVTEVGRGGHTPDFGKMIVLALREAFEAGVIPPTTKTKSTLATIYTSNEFISDMFGKNYLRNFAKKQWLRKDGKVLNHKEEWERVYNQSSHMLTKGIVCEPGDENLKACIERAQKFAEADHQRRYGLIPPGSPQ